MPVRDTRSAAPELALAPVEFLLLNALSISIAPKESRAQIRALIACPSIEAGRVLVRH